VSDLISREAATEQILGLAPEELEPTTYRADEVLAILDAAPAVDSEVEELRRLLTLIAQHQTGTAYHDGTKLCTKLGSYADAEAWLGEFKRKHAAALAARSEGGQ
jgi:hypothetical protein